MYAEHTEREPASVQCSSPGCKPGRDGPNMSPMDEFDQKLEGMIRDFALRIIVPRWTEFDAILEASIRVCDRHKLGPAQTDRRLATPDI
ncbi:MAG: hypothetical protein ACRD3B_11380 [Candidatus Sulfotelmatobacter sp.]